MAGVSTEQGDNKLNTELNLVPFIDLLSTLVLFLLVTAVWLQVAAIPASVKSKGGSAVVSSEQNKLFLHLTAGGYRLTWPAAGKHLPQTIARHPASGYDTERLVATLQTALKTLKISTAAVSADDNVDYGYVVQAIDTARTSGIPLVAISSD